MVQVTASIPTLSKNSALSHPHFESYRLASASSSAGTAGDATRDAEQQLAFDLPPAHPPRPLFEGLPPLGAGRHHAHVLDRFLGAHLAPGWPWRETGEAQAAYVDRHGQVVLIRLGREEGGEGERQRVSFHPLFKIDLEDGEDDGGDGGGDDGKREKGNSGDETDIPRQAPSIIALDAHTWLVSNGRGQISKLSVSQEAEGQVVCQARSTLVQRPVEEGGAESRRLQPVRIVAAAGDDVFSQTISRVDVSVAAYKLASPLLGPPLWTARTEEPLLYAECGGGGSGCVLLGSAEVTLSETQAAPKEASKGSSSQAVTNEEPKTSDADDELETLKGPEHHEIVQRLAKYTSELHEDSTAGLGTSGRWSPGPYSARGGGGSSLLEDGFEDEDANVGRDGYPLVVNVSSEGDVAPSSSVKADSTRPKGRDGAARTKILGVPLPSISRTGSADAQRVIFVRDGIDGLAYAVPSLSSSPSSAAQQGEGRRWEHVATMPAMAYVLASKQDASHRVYAHVPSTRSTSPESTSAPGRGVQALAFEGAPPIRLGSDGRGGRGPSGSRGAGNLFVYYAPPAPLSGARGEKVRHAESRVIRLGAASSGGSGSASGTLVGVAKVAQPMGHGEGEVRERELLLVLCENQLLVLPNLLL